MLLVASLSAHAKQVRIDSLRYWTAPDHTRMVFDVTTAVAHQIFLLQNPARLVIDFSDAKLLKPLAQPAKQHALFKRVRSAVRNKKDLRVVVDLKTAVTPKSFSLKPRKNYGNRLVIDLFPKSKRAAILSAGKAVKKPKIFKTVNNKARDIVRIQVF